MNRDFLKISGVIGALTVTIGAFGAHSLKKVLSPEALVVFETGVKYQFYHCIVLLLLAFYLQQYENKRLVTAFYSFLMGIVLFSGSLYWIATQALHGINIGLLGVLTPIGGLFFIAGWLYIAFSKK